MKKVISFILVISILLGLFAGLSFNSFARDLPASGSCGTNVTYTFDSSTGLLTISGTGPMRNYEYNTWSPFKNITSIKTIVINSGVTSIGNTFMGCTGLTNITIPDSVKSIGRCAFCGCTGLTSISIPDSVKSIGYYAFSSCSGLTSITVDANNPVFDSRNNCNAIINSKTNTLISGCKSTVIPNSVTSIDSGAFEYCSGLTSITIPNSVTSIGYSAFCGCTGLTSITIPDSVTSIGETAFLSCSGLTSVTIGNSVKSIDNCAFASCISLTSITIPDSVKSIDNGTFSACSGLTSITIPNSVTSICDYAFSGCSSLKDVYFKGTKEEWNSIYIGKNTCLTNATIFYNCNNDNCWVSGILKSLRNVSINWKVNYIEDSFGNKFNAHLNIYLSGADSTNGSIMMYSNIGTGFEMPWLSKEYGFKKSDFTSITIKGGNANPLEIIAGQFSGYTSLRTVTLNRVRIIQGRAFEGCTALLSVSYDQFLNHIGPSVFKGDTNLTYFSKSAFVSNIESIDDEAFYNTKIAGISLTNCKNIGKRAFYNAPLTNIDLGRITTSIDNSAFNGCENLIINCYKKSFAHSFAIKNNIKYVLYDYEFDDYLSFNSSYYDNDLARLAAEMSLKSYDGRISMESYLNELGFDDGNIYSNNYGGSLAFTVATKEYSGADADGNTDVLVIVAQGSTNIYELFNDSFSPADQKYDGYSVYGIVNDFKKAISDGLNKIKKSGKNYKVLLTGHSLGGAAVNLLGAQMTKQYGKNNVYCYTFGAINSIVSSSPITAGYENIHNIYNDLDTFSPYQYGGSMNNGAGSKYGKFGHLDVFVKESRSNEDKHKDPVVQVIDHINHDMDKYLSAVASGVVQNSYLRSCRNVVSKYSIVACPVDVEVYCDNKLVGRTVFNEVDETLSGVYIFIEDDVKIIVYPDNRDYQLKISAFDEGEMSYISQSFEDENQQISINNINLENGKFFSSIISGETSITDTKLYLLDSKGDNVAEIQEDGSEKPYEHKHAYQSQTVKPKSNSLGYTLHICECGDSFTTDYKAPTGKVSGLKCAARTATAEKFTWGKAKGASGYQIQISTKDGKKWDKTYNAKTANSYTIKSLTAGSAYKVRVRFYIKAADGKNYYGAWTTINSPTLPAATSLVKVTGAKKAFTAQWKKGAVTGYQLQYATNNKFTGAKTVTVKKAATLKYTVKNLAAKKAYYVRVRTYKTMNKVNYYSAWSGAKAVKTK